MRKKLKKLLKAVAAGEPDAFAQLMDVLCSDGSPHNEQLIEWCRSSERAFRRAAVELARGRDDAQLLDAIAHLGNDADEEVRFAVAAFVEHCPSWNNPEVIAKLLTDYSGRIREAAVRVANYYPDLHENIRDRLLADDWWKLRQEAAWATREHDHLEAIPVLARALAGDGDIEVRTACASSLEFLYAEHSDDVLWESIELAILRRCNDAMQEMTPDAAPRFRDWVRSRCESEPDFDELSTHGDVLTDPMRLAQLPRAHFVDEQVAETLRLLQGSAPKTAVLIGESGSGKTAIIHEVIHRLAESDSESGAWCVLRITPTEFLSGTKYLGEWETKLNEIVELIKSPRQVILYVPNIEELYWIGQSNSSKSNVASALAPYIERGEVRVLGESTENGFQRGVGSVPSLKRIFNTVAVKPADTQRTSQILDRVVDDLGVTIPMSLKERIIDLSGYHRSDSVQPGAVIELLRNVAGAGENRNGSISEEDILNAIGVSSGIPTTLLDDSIALNRVKVREFFDSRVMGQSEAVDCAVDLVTLVKAGLTDPDKPFGVMLFLGPTGVGKTELARCLAEYCFGDPSRLVRIDMSEYATYDAFERLLGQGSKPGVLTSAVRQQPFSILLFDEIEKAHFNIFDLCLQIFDAGRLTDNQGRTADFRRTIIVMTSNVGADRLQESPIGFSTSDGASASHREAGVRMTPNRDLSRTFRPEFLNRLDRIVHFHPLSEETAEKIAQRELSTVLSRSGIVRRRLFVDIDDGVVPLLLREGYSRTFGARPLKRTVERMVLLPLARAISAGETAPGSLVRLVARGNQVHVDVVRNQEPESTMSVMEPKKVATDIVRRTVGLVQKISNIREKSASLSARKSELLAKYSEPGFGDDPDTARRVNDEIYRCESVLADVAQLKTQVDYLRETLDAPSSPGGATKRAEHIEEAELRAAFLSKLVSHEQAAELGDAIITLSRVTAQGAKLNAVDRLARMYFKFAQRYGFELHVLDDRESKSPPADTVTMLVSGVGPYLLLNDETGLHQVVRGREKDRDNEAYGKETVRINVDPVPIAEAIPSEEIRLETRVLKGAKGRLIETRDTEVRLLHRPSLVSIRANTSGHETESRQLVKYMPWLLARIESSQSDAEELPLIRRYRLGPSRSVRDVRTGVKTGRVDAILDGRLEQLLRFE